MSKWKQMLSRVLCCVLSATMVIPAVTTQLQAKEHSVGTASVQYVDKDKNIIVGSGPEYEKQRAGISSVIYDGNTYYDVYGGIRPEDTTAEDFVKNMLTTETEFEYLEDGKKVKTSKSLFERWCQVAENVFVANSEYTMNEDKKWVTADHRGMDEDYCSIKRDLARTKRETAGDVGDDNVCATGLLYAKNRKTVRDEMGKQIARCVDGITNKDDYLKYSTDEGYPEALTCLNKDTEEPVYYSILTWVDELAGTNQYNYESFGIAFYDIKLAPFSPEGLEFITAATPYDSLEEASAKSPDVTLKQTGGRDNAAIEYFENSSKEPSNVSLQLSEKKAQSVANSLTTTKTNTFTQTVGLGWDWKKYKTGGAEFHLHFTFSASEAISTAWGETKTLTKEVSNTVSSGMTLPPHTAIGMQTYNTDYSLDYKYDLPVILNYKVAIFGLSGECWDDGIASKFFKTAQYDQECFETEFGSNEAGGLTARENLMNRAIVHKNNDNFEENYGGTYGWHETRGDGKNPHTINALNWSNIYSGQTPYVPQTTGETTIQINYLPVTKDGVYDPTSEPLMSPIVKTVHEDMETSHEAARSFPVGEQQYMIYTKPVYAADGVTDLNKDMHDLEKFTSPYSKALADSLAQQMKESDPIHYPDAEKTSAELMEKTHTLNFFYYPVQRQELMSVNPNTLAGDETANDSSTDPAVQSLNIKNAISWLAGFIPISSDGGELRLESRGYNTDIGEVVPLYPLRKTAVSSNDKVYNLISGDEIDLSQIHVKGYNADDVPFYGFDETKGYWEFCDENGAPIDVGSGNVVRLKEDKAIGRKTIVAGSEAGTVYMAYHINDDVYTYKDSNEYTRDSKVKSAMVRINVSEKPFTGSVKASGNFTGYVADEPVELNNLSTLKGYALDETDKKISGAAITWESQLDESDGIVITDGTKLSFTKAGTFKIRALYRNKYSEWVEVTALEKREATTLDLADEEHVLDTFIYDKEAENRINLDAMVLKGIYDQYGNPWTEDLQEAKGKLKWYVNGKLVERDPDNHQAIFTVPEEGSYKIQAKYEVEDSEKPYEITSDTFTLEVSEARRLASLSIESDALKENLGLGQPYALTLTDAVKVTALDQYGDAYSVNPEDYIWTTGEKYSKVEDGKLVGKVIGKDAISLTVAGITSNQIDYNVVLKPYVTELYTIKSDANATQEGETFDLTKVAFEAKDLNGDRYTLSDEEKGRISWSLTDEGTVKSQDVSFDEDSKQITVSEGTLNYGETGNVILTAEFVNTNGEKAVAAHVAIDVKQKPIIDSISLKQNGDRVLRSQENALLEDMFVVSGTDQYGKAYEMDQTEVTFASSNEEAFSIMNESSAAAKYGNSGIITAGKPDSSASITAQVINAIGKTVSSNGVTLEVPRVRKIASVEFTKVPASVPFNSVIKMEDLGAVCKDEKGVILTEEELRAYPATILYSMEAGETEARLDAETNQISTGNHTGTITVSAVTVNTGAQGNTSDIKSSATIWVGPVVDKITTNQTSYVATTPAASVTLTGKNLENGMEVKLLDQAGNVLSVANTTGDAETQTATLPLPTGDDPTLSHKYSVTCNLGKSGTGSLENVPSIAIATVPLTVGETFNSGIYTYRITALNKNGTANVDVTGFVHGKDTANVKILSSVKFKTVYCNVTGIGEKAFANNKKIATVNTGANVVKIGTSAFNSCSKITTVVVGNKTTNVGKAAFFKCTKLKKLTLGKSVKVLGAHSFCNAYALKSLKITSKKLSKIYGSHAFYGVKKVKLSAPADKKAKYKKKFKKAGIKKF